MHTLLLAALTLTLTLTPAGAQPVVSIRAGLVYRVEGAAMALGRPLEAGSTVLVQLAPGEKLETLRGFAEVSLGPGRVMRIGPGTLIALVRDDIENAAIRLVRGTAFVDWPRTQKGARVEILAGEGAIEIERNGLYRVDARSGRARLRVYEGKARVVGGPVVGMGRESVIAREALEPERFDSGQADFLDRWNTRRARAAERMVRAGTARKRRGGRRRTGGLDAESSGRDSGLGYGGGPF